MQKPLTLDTLTAWDAADPLKDVRGRFHIPGQGIYFNGNSLGPLPKSAEAALSHLLQTQWGAKGGAAWKQENWMDLPLIIGSKIAQVIGAHSDEVVVADSTTINLAKMLGAGLSLNPDRHVILSDAQNFPTDRYSLEDFVSTRAGLTLRIVDEVDIFDAIDESVALVTLTHINFRTGQRYAMEAINQRARDKGVITLWDLSHSAGAIDLDMTNKGADLAVGCTYKYLNGGPGAPAYIYVAQRHQDAIQPALPGWMGHARPFDFSAQYQPADGMRRHVTGTPPILALTVLNESLDIVVDVGVKAVTHKTRALMKLFLHLVQDQLSHTDIEILCGHDETKYGAQVSLQSAHAEAIVQAMEEDGLIADYRPPNIMRFGLAGLYVRYSDLWHAVAAINRHYPA